MHIGVYTTGSSFIRRFLRADRRFDKTIIAIFFRFLYVDRRFVFKNGLSSFCCFLHVEYHT